MKRPIVYIASPYTRGDAAINTRCQMQAFDELMNDGIVWPVIPLLSHFQHIVFPRHYQDWIDYDLALIERYDACLRLNAEHPPLNYCVTESSGADGEVALFRKQGKPVFYDRASLYEWAKPKRSIVAFSGVARSGKNTAAQGLDGFTPVAFADGVREALLALDPEIVLANLGSYLIAHETWDVLKDRVPEVRELLQRMGTEAGRNIHGDDCWIRLAKRKIDAIPGNVVITDVRFANEAAAIREWGGTVVRIERPGVEACNDHASERLDFEPDTTIVNDGTVADLHEKVRDLVDIQWDDTAIYEPTVDVN